MAKYANYVRVSVDHKSEEVILNFAQNTVNVEGNNEMVPIADIIMPESFAERLSKMLEETIHDEKKDE